jgi:hypothetical protein
MYNKDGNEWSLFNLLEDPKETKNIFGTGIRAEKKLKNELLNWINR